MLAGVGAGVLVLLGWPWLQSAESMAPLRDAASGRLTINSAPDLLALTLADQVLARAGIGPEPARELARFWMRLLVRVSFVVYLGWEVWHLWKAALTGRSQLLEMTMRASTRALLVLPLLVFTWVWSWYFSWALAMAAPLGWRCQLTRVVVACSVLALPTVYAHQYLNELLPGVFIVLMAVVPPVAWLASSSGRSTLARLRARTVAPSAPGSARWPM
jgi:hypothetical protein